MKNYVNGLFFLVQFLFLPALFAQTSSTVYNVSSKQGVSFVYLGASQSYSETNGTEVAWSSFQSQVTDEDARYKFVHSGYTNSKITKVSVIINMSDVDFYNGSGYSLADITMINGESGLPWSGLGTLQLQSLASVINNAPVVFDSHIGTNTSNYSAEYVIHDPTLQIDNSAYWDPNSTNLIIGLAGYSGTLNINSIQLRITYSVPPILNNIISPSSQTIFAGTSSATLNGTTPTGGNGSYTYQWQKSTDGGASWTTVSSSLSYSPGIVNTNTLFKRIVSSAGAAAVTSNIITVSTYPLLSNNNITSGNQTLGCTNAYLDPSILSGSFPSGGNGTYLYQWEINTSGTWSNIAGATSQSFDPPFITNNTSYTTTYYRRTVTSGGYYSNTSSPVSISFLFPDPILNNTITSASGNTIDDCINTTIDVPLLSGSMPTGGGGTGYTYEWYYSTNEGTTFSLYANSNSQDFDPPVATGYTIIYRKVKINNCNTPSASNYIYIQPFNPSNTISNNETFITCIAQPGIINGSVTAYGTPSYKWQQSTDLITWTDISGATGASYTPSSISATTSYKRFLRMADACPFIESTPIITKSIVPASTAISISTNNINSACEGGSIAMVASSPQPSSYQWYKDNITIAGATSTSYIATTNGSYSVQTNNTCGTFSSSSTTLTFTALPTVNIGSDLSLCFNERKTLNPSVGSNYAPLTYLWTSTLSGNFVSCATCLNPTFYANAAGFNSLTLTVKDGNNCSASDQLFVSINGRLNNINDVTYLTGNITTTLSLLKAYNEVYAGNSCNNCFTNIQSGGNASVRSGGFILINPGFVADLGSVFSARIGNPCLADNLRIAQAEEFSTVNKPEVFVYPNPSAGIYHIVLPEYGEVSLEVHDTYGNSILHAYYTEKEFDLDLTTRASGMYHLTLSKNENIFKNRIILVK